ncbi:MAG: thiamine/thiamine pyrophosphate ABC transporter permease ThiP, partial [Paracoccaceae bacterium]
MAVRAKSINPVVIFGGSAALLFVALLTVGPLIALWMRADVSTRLSGSNWSAIRFTVFQATLSAIISISLAIPVARALARRQFRGRALLLTLLGAPFLLPVIVAVFGLLAVWGRSGFVSQLLIASGGERIS